MNFYNKFKKFLKRPGHYFRYKKKNLRNLYFLISKFLHFKTYASRVRTINFPQKITDTSELIDRNEGYKLINLLKLVQKNTDINHVLDKINNDLKKLNFEKLKISNEGIVKLKSSNDFSNNCPEFNFVTNRYIIEIVSKYLKCIPILTSLSLWYSPNNQIFENSSQEYHLDHEDYRQVKDFYLLMK